MTPSDWPAFWLAVVLLGIGPAAAILLFAALKSNLTPKLKRFIEVWIFRPAWIAMLAFQSWNVFSNTHAWGSQPWITYALALLPIAGAGFLLYTWFKPRAGAPS